MDSKFSPRIKDVLSYSREEAIRLGNDHIGTEHIFLGIIRDGEGIAIDVMNKLHMTKELSFFLKQFFKIYRVHI